MSLWKRISSHVDCEQRMAAYYEEKGMLELRLCLAPWIEDRIMSEQITPNTTDQLERVALKFNEDLQQKLLSTRTASDQALKFRVVELCALIQRISAVELYTHLRSGLQKELQLVTEKSVAATAGQSMPLNPYNMNNTPMVTGYMVDPSDLLAVSNSCNPPVVQGIGPIHNVQNTGIASPALGMVTPKVELYEVQHQIMQSLNEFGNCANALKLLAQNYSYMLNSTSSPNAEAAYRSLIDEKAAIVLTMRRSFMYYESLHEMVIHELKNWRHQQAQAGNGAPFNEGSLDDIQRCFEMLESFIAHMLAAVKELMRVRLVTEEPELTHLLEQVQNAQKNLVCSAFIVDKQPPQVMKTNTRFAASVRWLIGSQLGIHNNPPTVECIIMSEIQSQRFVTRNTQMDNSSLSGQSSGEIQNASSTMEYQQNNHVFSASFRNMQLKKIKRAEKKGTESVMDEKFALFFYTTTTVNDFQIRVWTLSLPVVVIVHGNQEPQSWATITWDNAFAEIVRDPFMITDRVTWAQLSVALNIKFGSCTGRSLTIDNLDFLYEKLQREERSEYITWNQFCKEPMPDRSFTFWEWFFAIMKLTKDHMLGMWKAGCIMGFINKTKAQTDLLRSVYGIGTFLLRFSDSELGGVTIAYVNENGLVTMLAPWTARDFQVLNLADRIRDLDVLCWLHPSDRNASPVKRDVAFGEFYSKRQDPVTGYVKSTLHVHVCRNGENGSTSGTPHHAQESMQLGNGDFGMADFDTITNFENF
uniref:Isoform C of Signal transducer and transcription activator n=2 Tax=Drosophila melanogaster TaxID=7227 RepID=Q24151-2|nr:Signal-transducer and activator of transcription protein at 92E, isoform C [Drosophila melanogaster]NP_996242.1 Signal-transducer and activator of transcription protein at 92E, isoform E [Drosophila melanogaster]AAF55773.2 Signal-transducer and activator of transcription protein at 92E, isoform E [Drosophila melanogaster]AAN14350.2 Signal-transducer and activator of transcription protein at 92E, isoform C [Drosophila melanogaster]|eukprot:NP_732516.2 Signal-transducer and activator of transcription protein at 92E, isoform C [Drosophila melanogaster]